MTTNPILRCLASVAMLVAIGFAACSGNAQGTAFTYQGRLDSSGNSASGIYDLRFTIFDTAEAGAVVGGSVTNSPVAVSNGLFTVTLDFGNGVFTGAPRWLELGVRTNGGGAFVRLSPRQALTPTPYAMHTTSAGSANTVLGNVAASQLTGIISSNNIGAGSISSSMLAAGAVGSNQLATGAVGLDKLQTTTAWPVTRLINPTPNSQDEFGAAIAFVGTDKILVGAPNVFVSPIGEGAGEAYLFDHSGTLLTTITNPNPASGGIFADYEDNFGSVVASVGNELLLIGAYGQTIGDGHDGAAYLFNSAGILITTLTNPTPQDSDLFGSAVAGLGVDRVVVSAPRDNTGATSAGTVYLLRTNGVLLTTITNPTPAASDLFGQALATFGTDRLLIGAYADDTGAVNAGAAYLYHTNGNLLTTFLNPAPAVGDNFGWAVAAVGSEKVIISAPLKDFEINDAGVVYLFSTNGTLLNTFTNPAPSVGAQFGFAVTAAGADQVLIGSVSGTAFLFNSEGELLHTFANPTPAANESGLGRAVAALSAGQLVIGAPSASVNSPTVGEAYSFNAAPSLPQFLSGGVVDGAITAEKISGAIYPGQIPNLSAAKITSGLLSPDRIPGLDAAKITSGVFNTNRIPNLDATKITSGTMDSARLGDNVVLEDQSNFFITSQYFGAGSEAIPGITFNVDGDTGLWRPVANTLALTTGGAERLRVDAGGNVGIGETAPEGQLHITGNPATPQIKIETTSNNSFVKLRLESFGKPYWDFAVGGSANVMNWFYSATSQNLMSLSTNGTLTTVGPVNPPSDRNVKQDFTAVNTLVVLEKVAALPIHSWAYKNSPETRHIGPVAQDFHAAFQLNGDDDKHISTVDADGVALAAIQGLNLKLEEKLKARDAEIAELRQAFAEIKALIQPPTR